MRYYGMWYMMFVNNSVLEEESLKKNKQFGINEELLLFIFFKKNLINFKKKSMKWEYTDYDFGEKVQDVGKLR